MKLGFIGIGRIASAVVKGFCTSDIKNTTINLSPRNIEKSISLAKEFDNVNRLESNQSVLDDSDIIFIATPPDNTKKIIQELDFKKNHTVISFVSFLKYAELAEIAKPAGNICRAIPLPTVVNHNCPIPVFNSNETVAGLLNKLGSTLPVKDEKKLNALWTLTGLIAPFYDLLEELSSWAKSNDVEDAVANKFIFELFHSLTFLNPNVVESNFTKLKKETTTPNGMNEQALKIIKEKNANKAYKIAADNILKRFV